MVRWYRWRYIVSMFPRLFVCLLLIIIIIISDSNKEPHIVQVNSLGRRCGVHPTMIPQGEVAFLIGEVRSSCLWEHGLNQRLQKRLPLGSAFFVAAPERLPKICSTRRIAWELRRLAIVTSL